MTARRSFTVAVPFLGRVTFPGWVAHGAGVLALLWGGVWGWSTYLQPSELATARHAVERLTVEAEHYGLHMMEPPALAVADPTGAVALSLFDDGCVTVGGRGRSTRLLIDDRSLVPQTAGLGAFVAVLEAQGGRCLSRHPGPFSTRKTRDIDRCWVEVERAYRDGCRHVQAYNACSGAWDTNRDGSPRISWVRCVH